MAQIVTMTREQYEANLREAEVAALLDAAMELEDGTAKPFARALRRRAARLKESR